MIRESIVGPDGGEVVRLGPATVRILEDGSTTGHRLGVGEITVAPHSAGPPQHRHARHDEGSTSSPARPGSRSAPPATTPRPGRWR